MAIPFLRRLLLGGTPAADGELGRDATLKVPSAYDNGQLGTIARVVGRGTGTESFTNSVTTDQDFASVYTIPANALFANKLYTVKLLFETVTGVSSATAAVYLKLGGTKIFALQGTNMQDSSTRSSTIEVMIFGRAAPGAAADIACGSAGVKVGDGLNNTINQPIAVATNGDLAITPGVTFSATGGTESLQLLGWVIEEA